jgi:methylthioribose-1-phosphate isomerase
VNLAHAVRLMEGAAEELSRSGVRDIFPGLLERAHAYLREDLEANRRMAETGAALLGAGSRVITHCNAGALATSGIGTALGVIRRAFRTGRLSHVFPCETRPYLQGSRLTLWELMREGIPSTLITDNMAAHVMATERIDAVIVGADRIAANGDVCNKIGTYGLSILARHHGIPLFVAAPSTTVDLSLPDGSRIPIEERSSLEVTRIFGRDIAPRGARARHPAFDVTPAELVSAIVTEKGLVRPVGAGRLRSVLQG